MQSQIWWKVSLETEYARLIVQNSREKTKVAQPAFAFTPSNQICIVSVVVYWPDCPVSAAVGPDPPSWWAAAASRLKTEQRVRRRAGKKALEAIKRGSGRATVAAPGSIWRSAHLRGTEGKVDYKGIMFLNRATAQPAWTTHQGRRRPQSPATTDS